MKINAGNIPKLLFLEKSLLCLDPPGILFCLEFSESLREYILNFLLFTLYQKSSPKKWYSGKITHSFTSFVCGGNSQEIRPLRSYYLDDILLDGDGNGTPLQYSCLENPMDRGAWWAAIHGVAKSQTRLSDFTFTFHFHALEKEMATHSGVLAWRIPGMGEPGGLPSMGSHRVRHDWSDLAAAAAAWVSLFI